VKRGARIAHCSTRRSSRSLTSYAYCIASFGSGHSSTGFYARRRRRHHLAPYPSSYSSQPHCPQSFRASQPLRHRWTEVSFADVLFSSFLASRPYDGTTLDREECNYHFRIALTLTAHMHKFVQPLHHLSVLY
jgi:hypothetical protein